MVVDQTEAMDEELRSQTPPVPRFLPVRTRLAAWTRHPARGRLAPGVVPAVLMLGLGLAGAGRPALSWDEASTADIARRTPGQIWDLVHHVDAVIGPYYFLVHAWTRLAGTSETDLRLPSIVAMAAAVGLAGELGRRLFTPLIGLLAGLLLCLVPNSSRYAAEARPYAFTCLLSVLSLLLLLRALERPRRRRWIGYGVSVVLLGASHLIALATLAAHAAVAASGRRRGRPPRAWVVTLGACAVALLPVVWLGTRQRNEQLAWVDPLTPDTFLQAPGEIVGAANTAWLLIGLAVLARWRRAERVRHVAVLALAPPLAVAAVSLAWGPIWVARYLLVVLAPLAILAAVAVVGTAGPDRRSGRRGAVLRVVGIVALLAVTAYPAHGRVRGTTAKKGPDYRGVAALVARHQSPGDVIVYEARSRAMRAGMEYYLRRYPSRPRDVLERRPAAEVGRLRADEHPDAAGQVAGTGRVWLVVGGQTADPTTGQPALQGLLRERYDRIGIWHRSAATVALYRARPPG
ncbi:glycosyltransferase family 39 protein [Couchioplanes azureus]|uniref:glycosyltransferase family 39 protein n=1 Tax=Couchioplanes caeruleus TaxID=56438 RepID=UPI0016701F8C|nr:glycosyltransferase family 39 protein [Couchioplanes caeruleus]